MYIHACVCQWVPACTKELVLSSCQFVCQPSENFEICTFTVQPFLIDIPYGRHLIKSDKFCNPD